VAIGTLDGCAKIRRKGFLELKKKFHFGKQMGFCVRSRISLMLRELRNAINRHSGLDWEEKGINRLT